MRNQGIGSWMVRRARVAPERIALSFESRNQTYRELRDRIYRLAHGLTSLGIRPGDRVAYLGPNHPNYLETLFACGSIGAIFVPVNHRLAPPEIAYILDDAGCDILLYGLGLGPTVDSIRSDLAVRHYLALSKPREHEISFEELLAAQTDEPLDHPVKLDDLCLIAYTSGTTGRPKGAMLTHGNLTWSVHNFLSSVAVLDGDVSLAFAPLYRMGSLLVPVLPILWNGGTAILAGSRDADQLLRLIEERRPTLIFGGPDLLLALSRAPRWAEADLSSLRTCITGGSTVSEDLIRAYLERGVPITQGYGMTESAVTVTVMNRQDLARKVGSMGKPAFYVDLRVVNPDLSEVSAGEAGELLVHGPNVMKGYWNRPEATDETIIQDGWLRTGDAVRMDDEGYLYFVDRLKDVIVVGGENVFPAEVERVLKEHPTVEDAAVVGVPSGSLDETVMALIVPKKEFSFSADDLRRFCGDRIASYKVPGAIYLVDQLPRNPAGKLLKREIREQATREWEREGREHPRAA